MSLSITNNVASLTAQVNLNRTSSMLQKSLQRLSSGLKINSGADGPAALVISEEQKAQITGLQTAIDNTAKAVSLVQTAEGALNEVNNLLDKIRSLALDSANTAVDDSTALAANQAEVTNALSTIDRIANNTQFGTEKLLDGSLGSTVARSDVSNANVLSQLTSGLSNVKLADGNYQLKITTAYIPAAAAVKAASSSTITTGQAADFFADATGGTGGGANPVDAGTGVTNNSYFNDSGFVVVGNQSYAFDNTTKVSTLLGTITADPNSRFSITLDDSTHQFTVTAKNGGAVDNGVSVQILGGTHSGTLAATANGADAVAEKDAAGEIVDSTGASLASPILLTARPSSGGTVLENTGLGIYFSVSPTAAQSTGVKGNVYNVNTTGANAVFQIGANAGQTASISIGNAGTAALGTGIGGNQFASLSVINVTTASGAQDALAVIDKAISQISTQRADLGAFQANTLEGTSNNLQSTLQNTTAAEAVIRDTDFAAETANFTKAQVLMQVGTTVLQNANATSQLVLNLLK